MSSFHQIKMPGCYRGTAVVAAKLMKGEPGLEGEPWKASGKENLINTRVLRNEGEGGEDLALTADNKLSFVLEGLSLAMTVAGF